MDGSAISFENIANKTRNITIKIIMANKIILLFFIFTIFSPFFISAQYIATFYYFLNYAKNLYFSALQAKIELIHPCLNNNSFTRIITTCN